MIHARVGFLTFDLKSRFFYVLAHIVPGLSHSRFKAGRVFLHTCLLACAGLLIPTRHAVPTFPPGLAHKQM